MNCNCHKRITLMLFLGLCLPFAGHHARADMVPPPALTYTTPIPAISGQRIFLATDYYNSFLTQRHKLQGILSLHEEIQLDIYPTMIRVHGKYRWTADAKAPKEIRLGLLGRYYPEERGTFRQLFSVVLDGKSLPMQRHQLSASEFRALFPTLIKQIRASPAYISMGEIMNKLASSAKGKAELEQALRGESVVATPSKAPGKRKTRVSPPVRRRSPQKPPTKSRTVTKIHGPLRADKQALPQPKPQKKESALLQEGLWSGGLFGVKIPSNLSYGQARQAYTKARNNPRWLSWRVPIRQGKHQTMEISYTQLLHQATTNPYESKNLYAKWMQAIYVHLTPWLRWNAQTATSVLNIRLYHPQNQSVRAMPAPHQKSKGVLSWRFQNQRLRTSKGHRRMHKNYRIGSPSFSVQWDSAKLLTPPSQKASYMQDKAIPPLLELQDRLARMMFLLREKAESQRNPPKQGVATIKMRLLQTNWIALLKQFRGHAKQSKDPLLEGFAQQSLQKLRNLLGQPNANKGTRDPKTLDTHSGWLANAENHAWCLSWLGKAQETDTRRRTIDWKSQVDQSFPGFGKSYDHRQRKLWVDLTGGACARAYASRKRLWYGSAGLMVLLCIGIFWKLRKGDTEQS